MNVQLPPRRALPPEIKERMRPRPRRSGKYRVPLAAAAVVALLAAGGVIVTQSVRDRSEPLTPPPSPAPTTSSAPPPDMRPRTEPTTADDLARCAVDGLRARFTLVKPGVRLVVGEERQFCELTYTRVSTSLAAPPQLALAGDADSTIVWQSQTGVIVLTAPATAREVAMTKLTEDSPEPSGVLRDGLAFVWQLSDETVRFVLPDRQVTATVDLFALHSSTDPWYETRDAFPSGGTDPTTAENQAARCVDFGSRQPAHPPLIKRPGWEMVGEPGRWRPGARVGGGMDSAYGLLVLHDGAGGLAYCELNDGLAALLNWTPEPDGNSPARLGTAIGLGGTLLLGGPAAPEVGQVELTGADGQPVAAQVQDGTWAVTMGHQQTKVKIKVLDRGGAVLYAGDLALF